MTTFSAMDIGRTGVGFSKYWLDTIAHNLANLNTVAAGDEEPFRARLVVAQQLDGRAWPVAAGPAGGPRAAGAGVAVGAIAEQDGDPARVHDPDHPLADDTGHVALPVVDMAGQMSDLILATRTYQANLRAIESAREAYQAALRLGQG